MEKYDDDAIEKLLRSTPTTPTPPDVRARFDELISEQATKRTKPAKKFAWFTPLLVAASLLAVSVIGYTITRPDTQSDTSLASDLPSLTTMEPSTTTAPSVKPSTSAEPTTPSTTKPADEPLSSDSTSDGASDFSTAGGGANALPIMELFSGLAYDGSLREVRDYVQPERSVGSLSEVSALALGCIKRAGLANYVSALDNGTYQGKDVIAVFSPLRSGGFRITLLSTSCAKVAVKTLK